MKTGKGSLSGEEFVLIQAASLFEQLIDPVKGIANSARLLQNAIECFPMQARHSI